MEQNRLMIRSQSLYPAELRAHQMPFSFEGVINIAEWGKIFNHLLIGPFGERTLHLSVWGADPTLRENEPVPMFILRFGGRRRRRSCWL